MRLVTSCFMLLHHPIIPTADHLIQKEIIPLHAHLANNCLIATKPSISLFSSRRIKTPFPPLSHKIGPHYRVAPLCTEFILILVFFVEVEDSNGKSALQKVVLISLRMDVLKYLAV